jgi:hypothetical protein
MPTEGCCSYGSPTTRRSVSARSATTARSRPFATNAALHRVGGEPSRSNNSMPKVRGSFAGTEIRRSSRAHGTSALQVTSSRHAVRDPVGLDVGDHALQFGAVRALGRLPGINELGHDPRPDRLGLMGVGLPLGGDREPLVLAALLRLLLGRDSQVGDGRCEIARSGAGGGVRGRASVGVVGSADSSVAIVRSCLVFARVIDLPPRCRGRRPRSRPQPRRASHRDRPAARDRGRGGPGVPRCSSRPGGW